MPEKDGDDDKKSTKSVVNKKQKQMMGEEGYDIARDMGRVRPSKDKKDATTMPVSKEMRKTQKVNKGPSALELVKKKYGKDISKDNRALQKLRRECERAKRSLSNQHQVRVEIESLFDGEDFSEPLTRACLLYTSPSPRDATLSRMPSSA